MEINEPAIVNSTRYYSIEEYLEMEDAATEKHEYYQGQIVERGIRNLQQNIISGNLLGSIGNQLKGKSYRPFGSDLRIHVEKNTLFAYPDLSIIYGELISLNNDDMNFLNPTVIFEVSAYATRNVERISKFKLYRDIPTLKAYILVDPASISIEDWFINSSGHWELKEYTNIDQILDLSAIQVSVALKDIYEGTKIAS